MCLSLGAPSSERGCGVDGSARLELFAKRALPAAHRPTAQPMARKKKTSSPGRPAATIESPSTDDSAAATNHSTTPVEANATDDLSSAAPDEMDGAKDEDPAPVYTPSEPDGAPLTNAKIERPKGWGKDTETLDYGDCYARSHAAGCRSFVPYLCDKLLPTPTHPLPIIHFASRQARRCAEGGARGHAHAAPGRGET